MDRIDRDRWDHCKYIVALVASTGLERPRGLGASIDEHHEGQKFGGMGFDTLCSLIPSHFIAYGAAALGIIKIIS